MNQKHLKTLALGAAIAGSLAAVSAAQASPFTLTTLGNAYLAAEGDAAAKKAEGEMKCGADKAKAEGKCGGDKAKGEGKCGEGKCGADMKEDEKKDGEKKPEQA